MTAGPDAPQVEMQGTAASAVEHAASPGTAPALRRRRSLALLVTVTIVVLTFALVVFAWMYWLNPFQV